MELYLTNGTLCYKEDSGVTEVLPTRWRHVSFAYKMAAFLRVLPTRWWRGSFAYKMAAFLTVLATRWWCRRFPHKMAAMPHF